MKNIATCKLFSGCCPNEYSLSFHGVNSGLCQGPPHNVTLSYKNYSAIATRCPVFLVRPRGTTKSRCKQQNSYAYEEFSILQLNRKSEHQWDTGSILSNFLGPMKPQCSSKVREQKNPYFQKAAVSDLPMIQHGCISFGNLDKVDFKLQGD